MAKKKAKEESAKKTNKAAPNKKLKRTILGTLSGVCMASALIVAAIPVKESTAADPSTPIFTENVKASLDGTAIPAYTSDTNGDSIFYQSDGQFGVERVMVENVYEGVLVYFKGGNENLGTVTIPKEIEAYKYYPFTNSEGKVTNIPCPVDSMGYFLYYMPDEETVVSGNTIVEKNPAFSFDKAVICTSDAESQKKWREKDNLYAIYNNGNSYKQYINLKEGVEPGTDTAPFILPISYIGSTRWVVTTVSEHETSGHYFSPAEGDTGDQGVFAGITNFSTINIPGTIRAIGDYAFKGCAVQNVNIGAGVAAIGNHAFDGCIGLRSVDLRENNEISTSLKEIGSFAFANCSILGSIDIPDSVTRIGSGCFMNDLRLYSANLYGHTDELPGNTNLTELGNGAFYNCTDLKNMYLPRNLSGVSSATHWFYGCKNLTDLIMPPEDDCEFHASNVTGCYQLLTVTVLSESMDFSCPNSDYDYCEGDEENDTFGSKNLGYNTTFSSYQVDDAFRIICYRGSDAYYYACRHEYSVEYLNDDEKGKLERVKNNLCFTLDVDENGVGTLTHIEPYKPNGDVSIMEIPNQIGKYEINIIRSGFLKDFDRKKEIQYVYMPDTIRKIGADCFVGCETLEEVEFANAMAVEEIGSGAFNTGTMKDINLHFVGDVSRAGVESAPFQYAMTMENKYNDPNNPAGTKYISYVSPFPSNLEIELVVEKVKDEVSGMEVTKGIPTLVGAPTFKESLETPNHYSISTNKEVRDEQNEIATNAYIKYVQQVSANTVFSLDDFVGSDNEKAVLNAVLHPNIPEGVYNMTADVYQKDEYLQSITLNSIANVPDEAFKGCTDLRSFYMNSSGAEGGEKIGDRVFEDDDMLVQVTLPSTLTEMGDLPFYLCSELTKVDFPGNPIFSCTNGIIYELLDDGTKRIVECLEKRGRGVSGSTIDEEEFENVSEIAPGAFMGCKGVSVVYFGEAPVQTIPENCFRDCTDLGVCSLSPSTSSIGQYAFRNTKLSGIKIPNGNASIRENAFTKEDGVSLIEGMTIECEVPSTVATYADNLGFEIKELKVPEYEVKFYTYDGSEQIGETQYVKYGSDAVPPEAPAREGYVFIKWFPDYTNVKKNLEVVAQYELEENTRNVIFYQYPNWDQYKDSNVILTQFPVVIGDPAPDPPTSLVASIDGYRFEGVWLPMHDKVPAPTADETDYKLYPYFVKATDSDTQSSGSSGTGTDGTGTDGNGTGSGSGGTSSDIGTSDKTTTSDNTSSTGNNNNSGSSNSSSSTSATTGTTASSGSSGGSGGSVSQNKTTNKNNGTSVVVTKPGITNSNLVSATVNGSTDDFVLKISDSDSAKAAVEQALLNEYGSLEDIRYFAMDISLYDKTGTTKIQNLDGITVTITMPIPDALTSYGGNNKAASVINGTTLEKMETKFTTIDGVPCISFVARHFSPYTIYTDLNNLTASLNGSDMTPKTGDPIHPKWFLSIGLALFSIVLFFLKGSNKKVVKVIA